ncbi:MAG: hypothetical protein Q7R31_01095, partial [Candidatus Levybacteria bacterium]|nr:hypothetical protein [Candidatus Levybacteria bacterium]
KQDKQNRPLAELKQRFSLYLMEEEIKLLSEDPIAWLDERFDILYKFAEEGQELNSPIIQGVHGKVQQAIDLVQKAKPEALADFMTQFAIRLHLLQMRAAIGLKNIDQVKGAAHELRAHGLLAGMALEEGMVGVMFNRLQDMLESTRLSSNTRHHVTLEDASRLQGELVNEQMELAKKGVGNFGDLSGIAEKKGQDSEKPDTWDNFTWAKQTDKKIEENKEILQGRLEEIRKIKKVSSRITRSVRTAYDVFVSSQRMGVVVARGKYLLKDSNRYRSDPIGPLNVYNMEELLFEKFDMYSPEQEELMNRIRLDMADSWMKEQKEPVRKLTEEQRLDLGKRLFRDIFVVPDFFSSGWRIEGVIEVLEQRFGEETAEDLALFMRLKLNGREKDRDKLLERAKQEYKKENGREMSKKEEDEEEKRIKDDGYRKYIWEKIKTYRPEEIIRLFRERKNDRVAGLYDDMIAIDSNLKLTKEEELANRDDEGGRGRDLTVYDKFKQNYGAVIGLLRQEGFNVKDSGRPSPTQVNLSNLNEEQKKIVDGFLGVGGWKKLSELAKAMQDFIGDKKFINDLLTDTNFADIYTRSIIIDDALLDKLEDEKPDSVDRLGISKLEYAPLSKKIGEAGAGGDTLVRSWTDTENAAKAGNALLKFIKEEDLEKKTNAALEFAGSASMYNGLGPKGQAEGVRYTIGTYLNLSKLDIAWDIIGINSLPLRIPASDAQRIFGPQAKAMGRDELRKSLDHLRGFLTSSITKAREQLREDEKALETSILYDTPEKRAKRKEELKANFARDEKGSQKFYKNMEGLLEVTSKDFWKRTGLRLLLYLMLAAIGETYMAAKSSSSK